MTALRERVGSARLGLGSRRVPQLVFVVICLAVGIFVVLPIGALIIQTVYRGHAGFQGLSTYRNVFEQPQIRRALVDTAYLAIGSMALAVPLGAGLAWVISSVNVPFAKYLNVVPLLPMFLPPLVGALGWEFLLSPRPGLLNVMLRAVIPGHQETGPLNIYNLWGIIWVNSLYVTPYVYLIVINAFRQYDSALDDAARVVGSSGPSILWRITIPVLRPALIGGGILALVTTIGDFSVPLILGQPTGIPVLTTQIYNELSNYPQNIPAAASLSMVTILITVIALYLQRRWLRGRARFVTVGGRGTQHRITMLGPVGRWSLFGGLVAYVLIVVVAPIVGILNVALRPYWTTYIGPKGLSWQNFRLVLHDSFATTSIKNSLELALIGASAGIALALLIGYTVQRSNIRGRAVLDYVATIPLAIPGTVFGASLLYFFLDGPVVLYGTDTLLLIAYIGHFLPQGFRTVSAALAQTSPELEESAMVVWQWMAANDAHGHVPSCEASNRERVDISVHTDVSRSSDVCTPWERKDLSDVSRGN